MKLTEGQLQRFGVDSKLFYKRLSHFYKALEQADNIISKYKVLKRDGLRNTSTTRNLTQLHQDLERSLNEVKVAKATALALAKTINNYITEQDQMGHKDLRTMYRAAFKGPTNRFT